MKGLVIERVVRILCKVSLNGLFFMCLVSIEELCDVSIDDCVWELELFKVIMNEVFYLWNIGILFWIRVLSFVGKDLLEFLLMSERLDFDLKNKMMVMEEFCICCYLWIDVRYGYDIYFRLVLFGLLW